MAQSDELDSLTRSIDKTNRALSMKFKREHKYQTEIYEEQLYKEVVYDTRVDATEKEEFRFMNPLKKARPGGGGNRNLAEAAKLGAELAQSPLHQRKRRDFLHLHPELNSKRTKMYDPYSYMRDAMNKDEEEAFLEKEQNFLQLMLLKSDMLTKQLWRE